MTRQTSSEQSAAPLSNDSRYTMVFQSLLKSRSDLWRAANHPNVEIVEKLLLEAAIATKDWEMLQIEQHLANEKFARENFK